MAAAATETAGPIDILVNCAGIECSRHRCGLAPHVLHNIGLLAGTALVAGAAGTTVFGLLGLVAAIPLLLRLKRRFGSW